MDKARLERICNRLFKNVNSSDDWVNFSCAVAPYSHEHGFKEDGNPSAGARVLPDGNVYWHCFACKGSGSMQSLFSYLHSKTGNADLLSVMGEFDAGFTIVDYDRRLDYLTVDTIEQVPLEYTDIFDKLSGDALEYVLKRGISLETIDKLDLQYDKSGNRVVFPVKSFDKKIYGFTGRAIGDKYYAKIKDYYFKKSQFVLGVEHWKPRQPCITVEGLFAYAKLHEITKDKDFPYNIGAIMGSSASAEQVDTLLCNGSYQIVMLDNDGAGEAGMYGKQPMSDWSQKKIELEKAKGLVYKLNSHVLTKVCVWPKKIDGTYKTDPDDLCYEELKYMLDNALTVYG